MKCDLKGHQRVDLLLERTSAAAMAHFEICPSCRETSLQQSALWKTLDSWVVPQASSRFDRELYAKIDSALSAPWYERWAAVIRPVFLQPSLALGFSAVVIVAGFVFDHQATSFSSVSSAQVHASGVHTSGVKDARAATVPVSGTEAEQVEKTLDDLEMLRQFDLASEEKETVSKSM